jgi:hypothetical protein
VQRLHLLGNFVLGVAGGRKHLLGGGLNLVRKAGARLGAGREEVLHRIVKIVEERTARLAGCLRASDAGGPEIGHQLLRLFAEVADGTSHLGRGDRPLAATVRRGLCEGRPEGVNLVVKRVGEGLHLCTKRLQALGAALVVGGGRVGPLRPKLRQPLSQGLGSGANLLLEGRHPIAPRIPIRLRLRRALTAEVGEQRAHLRPEGLHVFAEGPERRRSVLAFVLNFVLELSDFVGKSAHGEQECL